MDPHLPAPRALTVVQLPDGTYTYTDPAHLPAQPVPPQVVQHIHQAPPDRTVQRLALGSGIGAGTVAAGVYFGPLLVGALTAIAANLAILAFLAVALTWGVVTVVKSVGGPDGKATPSSLRKTRRG
ncbi:MULTISPECIES: DUF6251 family protein [unclassified Streptomyces]|uniref:DUF6251 family protein n=1 Tax=unclassified Streptomyces TaxID=2593676 RepID=UPI000CD511D8|nr:MULTISPECIES: DUF6251 family protein [unclassified Streptomyces]AWL39824.1 hypothetical protein B9S64_18355 [Streptomyces sp. SM18]